MKQEFSDTAKVLFIDHESSYNIGCFFQNRQYEVSILKILKHKQIISTAWSWLGSSKVEVLALPMLKTYRKDPENNRELVDKIKELYDQADIIIGHNINNFDDKMSNTEFIKYGLCPSPHKTVDTLKIARDKFCFPGNRLDDLGEFLKVGKKVKHDGFTMWEQCMNGDQKAWKEMLRYNVGDVVLLKKIYYKFLPFITNHPAMRVRGDVMCDKCGSRNLISRGTRLNRTGRIPQYQCKDCRGWNYGIRIKDVVSGRKKWVIK